MDDVLSGWLKVILLIVFVVVFVIGVVLVGMMYGLGVVNLFEFVNKVGLLLVEVIFGLFL